LSGTGDRLKPGGRAPAITAAVGLAQSGRLWCCRQSFPARPKRR
jgi:hypothetical protein